ncbi:MAG: SulP family inorganic anion transporter [Acidobacteria bacterium]|nr:SulP family inorganic anion transporter [Acidobacteriota bacterium]
MKTDTLASDALASVVVFLVALPLCMGIAIASGVPPALGLITGIIGGIVVASFSGCPLQVSGPAAGLSVIVFQMIQEHGVAMLGPIVLLAGVIQVASGLLRVGQMFRAISPAVIHGMLAGIGALIFAAQFHVMVDHVPKAGGLANLAAFPEAIALLFEDTDHDHHLAAIVGFVTLGVMAGWAFLAKGRLRTVPAALAAVLVGTTLAQAGQMHIHYVKLPGNLLEAVTWTNLPGLAGLFNGEILGEAFALAFIASAETLLSAAAVDKMAAGRQKTNYDRELLSQGIGNSLCGMLGALPMTGVIVRSAANVNAGAKTRVSAILHGLWLMILALVFPGVLQTVPTACLAAILVFTGIKLLNFGELVRLRTYGWPIVAIAVITMGTIISSSLLTGIVVGILLSLVKVMWAISRLDVRVDHDPVSDRVDVIFEGSASFVNLPRFTDALDELPNAAEIYVHLKQLNYVDHAAVDALSDWEKIRRQRGGQVHVEWTELMNTYALKNRTPVPQKVPAGSH